MIRETEKRRVELRRQTHDLNQALADLLAALAPEDPSAADAVRQARMALFDAWTILCTPPEDDDDH